VCSLAILAVLTLRFYRTGDLCRWSDTGDIIYAGRADHQVKLRGQRLEIGEIEACIMRTDGVANCVVVKRTDDGTQQDFLVAFVEGRDADEMDETRTRVMAQCQSQLASYMVPSVVVMMEKLPLNPNGKIDRKLLRETVSIEASVAASVEKDRYVLGGILMDQS
jgi:acyl-coenzyme A synthetase/AMP-(fatty) acid ligase